MWLGTTGAYGLPNTVYSLDRRPHTYTHCSRSHASLSVGVGRFVCHADNAARSAPLLFLRFLTCDSHDATKRAYTPLNWSHNLPIPCWAKWCAAFLHTLPSLHFLTYASNNTAMHTNPSLSRVMMSWIHHQSHDAVNSLPESWCRQFVTKQSKTQPFHTPSVSREQMWGPMKLKGGETTEEHRLKARVIW